MGSKQSAVECFKSGNIKGALKIAKEFQIGIAPEQREIMRLGYECFVHEKIYIQMGYNIEKARRDAVTVLKQVLGLESMDFSCLFCYRYAWCWACKNANLEQGRGCGVTKLRKDCAECFVCDNENCEFLRR